MVTVILNSRALVYETALPGWTSVTGNATLRDISGATGQVPVAAGRATFRPQDIVAALNAEQDMWLEYTGQTSVLVLYQSEDRSEDVAAT